MSAQRSAPPGRGIATAVLLAGALLIGGRLGAQVTTTDSLRAVIDSTRARSRAAARVFLDSTRTIEERARAAFAVGAFLDSADAAAALRVAGNARESESIRALALGRGAHIIDGDPTAESALLRWVGRESPPAVRVVAMNTLAAMLVGSGMRTRRMPEIVRVFKELSSDQDSTMRRSALAWLATSGDAETVSRLVRSLTPGGDPLVTPAEAVVLLGTSGSDAARAAIRPLLQQGRDLVARTEAIRVLGSDPPSAPYLDRLVADASEPDTIRAAALGAVFANRPQDFQGVSLPLISDERANDDLRVFAIDAVRLRVTAPARQLRISPSSGFNETMRRLARESASQRVRAAAAAYLREQRL